MPGEYRGKQLVQKQITGAVCERHKQRFDQEKVEAEERKAKARSEAAKRAAKTLSVEEMTN